MNFVRYILGFVDFFSGSGSASAISVRIKKNDHMKKLISKGSANAKTAKNAIETHILYLMPSDRNSKNVNLCQTL